MAPLESPTAVTADFDGHVDVVGNLHLVDSFGRLQGDAMYDRNCDVDHDGAVDVVDLPYVVYNFGT